MNILDAPNICAFCDGGGKCSACDGTGVNPRMNEPEPKCQRCAGTGTCPQCLGTGKAHTIAPAIMDLGLNKL